MSVVSHSVLDEHYRSMTRDEITDEDGIWDDGTLSRVFSSVPRDASFIDFGCGYGRFIPAYKYLGFERAKYAGIDFIGSQIAYARDLNPGYRFEECSLQAVGERFPASFDAFACICVLMYVPDDLMVATLRSMRASLRPGAVGFISTPEGDGLQEATYGHILNTFTVSQLSAYATEASFTPHLYEAYGMIHGMLIAA